MKTRTEISFIRRAFTLVELLVVVGIITVLVALLFPALSGAREHANRIKCLATLRSMGQAAQMHAQDHRGYMPVAGFGPPGWEWPDRVGDAGRKKYTYYKGEYRENVGIDFVVAPLSASLGQYMGLPIVLGTRQEVQASLQSEAVYRHFTCASDAEPQTGNSIASGGWRGPEERMSYLYNARVLSFMVMDGVVGLGGNVSQVRHPEQVFLFADGQGGVPPPRNVPYFGVISGDTLYDYWRVHGLSSASAFPNLDARRHKNRINVLFVDGHGETLMLPDYRGQNLEKLGDRGGITRVGVAMGISN